MRLNWRLLEPGPLQRGLSSRGWIFQMPSLLMIADLDMERAGKVAERWNIPEYVREYSEIFGKVDAVVVVRLPLFHMPGSASIA